MDTKGDLALLERLAVARLQYTVNELQTKVDFDRRSSPPVRKIFHCITDDSALVQSIGDFKRWTSDGAISMTVPLCTLDALDDLKKGTDLANVNSRESIRHLDRCQSGATTGRKPVRGVRVQAPTEMFNKWDDCAQFQNPDIQPPPLSPSPPRNSSYSHHHRRSVSSPQPQPPRWIQPILNCALWKLHPPGREARTANEMEETVLVTNCEAVAAWARVYGVRAVDSGEIAEMVERENWEFAERKRVYEAGMSGGGRRNGSISGRGGRGGGGGGGRGGGHRRDSSREENGGFGQRRGSEVEEGYVLRGAPRGVARGRGKLWEP